MRHIIPLIIVVALLIAVGATPNLGVQAQGAQCFGLAQVDCDTLRSADENYAKLKSFQFEITYFQSANTITRRSAIAIKGTGKFAIDAMPPLTDFALIGVLALNVEGLKLSLDYEEKVTTNNNNVTIQASTVVVDGVIYTKNADADEWEGRRITDILGQVQQSSSQTNPLIALQEAIHDPSVTDAIAASANIKGFMKVVRSDNAPVVEGQKQIEFVYSYDVRRLLLSPEFYPILKALVSATGITVSDSELPALAKNFAKITAGSTFKFTRWVGSQDKLNHAFFAELLLNIKVPSGASGNGLPDVMNGVGTKQRIAIKMTKIGQPVKVEAPEGSTVAGE